MINNKSLEGSIGFYLVIQVIHICWFASGLGGRGVSLKIHFLTVQGIHFVFFTPIIHFQCLTILCTMHISKFQGYVQGKGI